MLQKIMWQLQDFEKLKKWSNKQKISYFLVSRERKILFDNFYVEDNLLKPAENDMLNYTWYFLQNVKFEDGDADVYIYADYEVKIKLFLYLRLLQSVLEYVLLYLFLE